MNSQSRRPLTQGLTRFWSALRSYPANEAATGGVGVKKFGFLLFPGIERRQDERCASALSADRTDATFPLEVGDSRKQCIIRRIDTVQDGQLAQIEARMQMQLAQY